MTRTGAEEAAKVRPKPIMNLRVRSVSPGFAQSSTNDVPSTNEHADGLGSGLEGRGSAHDNGADEYGRSSPKTV